MEKLEKKIFVVDGCLKITTARIPKRDWSNKGFAAEIGGQPILVLKHGWNEHITYAGFATKPGALHFKEHMQEMERKVRRERTKRRRQRRTAT